MNNAKKIPLVSIITPVYNREDLISETILSVLQQDYNNFEYIIIDDGSIDNSLKIINKYKNNKKIKIYSHNNIGETKTVNKGFVIAKGEIICVLSSDDILLPKAISSAVMFFNNNPKIVVAYPDWEIIDEKSKRIGCIKTHKYSYINMVRWHHCFPGPGTFIRKEIISKLKGRNPRYKYVADFDFWLRAGLVGEFARINKTLSQYRVHKNSGVVKSRGIQMANEHIELIKQLYSLPNLRKNIIQIKNEAISSAYYVAAATLGNNHLFLRIKYVLLSFYYKPIKYFGEYRFRIRKIFQEVLK